MELTVLMGRLLSSFLSASIMTNSVLDLAPSPIIIPTNPPPYIPPDKDLVLVYPPVLVIAALVREVVIASRTQQGENILLTPREYLTS